MHLRCALTAAILAALCLDASLGQTPAGAAFTYQGRLEDAGGAYTGSADFQFSLWDAATTPPGVQVGLTQTATDVSTSNGLFTQLVDFGPLRFEGHARWLQIAVRTPSGSGGFTILSPRQPISAVPYAASLALPLESTSSNGNYDAFTIIQAADAFSAGVFAILSPNSPAAALRASHAGIGPAVAGLHQPTGNYGWVGTPDQGVLGSSPTLDGVAGFSSGVGKSGVYGTNDNPAGYGVFGWNTASNNVGYFGGSQNGAYGWTANPSGAGGYFENASSTANGLNTAGVVGAGDAGVGVYGSSSTGKFGVYGTSPGPTGFANTIVGAGVLGDSSTNDGVTGICSAASRSGVSGYAQDVNGGGVYGKNSASGNVGGLGTASYGAWGSTGSASGYGGYFQNYGGGVALYADGPVNALAANEASAIYGQTTAGSSSHAGVRGVSTGLDGNGVIGEANNGTNAWGVGGLSQDGVGVGGDSTSGTGVLGQSTSGSGVVATSDTGTGLSASSNTNDGVAGGSGGDGVSGVYGYTDTPSGFGVSGWNWAVGTNGALASGTAGVAGFAYGTGTNYGVYGSTASSDGYGGYFAGRGYFSDFVGIKIEQPAVPLQVAGGTDASLSGGGNIVVGQIGAANIVMDNNEIMARNNGAASTLILNAPGGGVAIGTNNANGFLLAVNGSAAKPGGGSWSTLSDARLKKYIHPLADTLDRLLALRGVSFEYRDPAAIHELPGQRIGMIAQEVEPVFPDWIDKGPDGYKRITYRGFEALTVEALRDLRAEKDAQLAERDARIKALEHENAAMEERVARLETLVGELASENK